MSVARVAYETHRFYELVMLFQQLIDDEPALEQVSFESASTVRKTSERKFCGDLVFSDAVPAPLMVPMPSTVPR